MERQPAHEIGVLDPPIVVLVGDDIGPLVGVHAQVEELRNAQAGKWLVPDLEATRIGHLAEDALPILVPEGDQHAVIIVVRKVVACALRLLTGQVGELVVAVEMNLVFLATDRRSLEQIVLDRRVAGGGEQRREPIEAGEHLI